MFGQTAVSLFPVQNYNFGEKAAQPSKDTSVEARIQRIRQQCACLCRPQSACPVASLLTHFIRVGEHRDLPPHRVLISSRPFGG